MSQIILEVDKLSVAFYGNEVVRDVSFHVERGETLALW
jgi:ABC-type branched-subunit amino acid transport system ATPase component